MVRQKGMGKKVAFAILGTPPNLKFKKSSAQKEVDYQLDKQNMKRIR